MQEQTDWWENWKSYRCLFRFLIIGIVKLGHAAFIPGTVSGLDRDLLIIVRIIFQANIQSAIIQLGKGIAADVDFIHAGKVIACFHTEQLALNPRTDRRGFPVKDLNVTVLGVGLSVLSVTVT